jgi:hypothetical protein
MPPRPQDAAVHGGAAEVHVRLVDVEPVAGLVAATARFCAHLNRDAIEAMPDAAVRALSEVQAILWRLEQSRPEQPEQEG